MTNVYGSAKKVRLKARLFQIGVEALEREGWRVSRVPGSGKSSVRRITRGTEKKTVSIRTSQDTWIAFPRTPDDNSWRTLSDVDAVVAVSVDQKENPRAASVHMLPGDEMRDRFDRAYRARLDADHSIPVGRGVWVALYEEDAESPPRQVGAGAGLKHPAFATVRLKPEDLAAVRPGPGVIGAGGDDVDDDDDTDSPPVSSSNGPVGPLGPGGARPSAQAAGGEEEMLTIAEAKRRLALTFGVDVANIKITVEA
jgi:hypothetical protein